ncbi:MAG: hypothetical protein QW076_02915 [Candidatus Anstonellales archaeon]
MKGQMEITEDFLKLIQIAIIVVGVLAIFFEYVNYNVIVNKNEAAREALVLGNALLTSNCLTYSNTPSLFSEEKLNTMSSDSSCFKYAYGNVTVILLNDSKQWSFVINDTNILNGIEKFYVAVKLNTGEVKQAIMVVEV